MDRRQVIVWGLVALAAAVLGAGCRPRIRVKARPKRIKPNELRPAAPPRPRTRQPSLRSRITDAQGDALLDGLIHEVLGIDDLETRIEKMSEAERMAALRQAKRRPRSPRLDRVQRALESSRSASRTRVRGR